MLLLVYGETNAHNVSLMYWGLLDCYVVVLLGGPSTLPTNISNKPLIICYLLINMSVGLDNIQKVVLKISYGLVQNTRYNVIYIIPWYMFCMRCPCCGDEMVKEKESEKTVTLKCGGCGLSNTELKGWLWKKSLLCFHLHSKSWSWSWS